LILVGIPLFIIEVAIALISLLAYKLTHKDNNDADQGA
jgi:hypothetical protein